MRARISIVCTLGLSICRLGFAAPSNPATVLKSMFPKDVEEALALSGAPEHLRANATVYIFGAKGYEKTREGTNGFTCLLNRDAFLYGASKFKPTCWDSVGKDTYVPVMLRVGVLLAAGKDADTVKHEIAEGFRQGEFHRPTTGGVAYMMAGDLELDPETGKPLAQAFPGHYMFYALGASSVQLGTTREAGRSDPTLPSVTTIGAGVEQGLAYIIAVPGAAHQHDATN